MTAEDALDRDAIKALIPHRDPFLLLDRADGYVAGERLTGYRALAEDDPVFAGHFPGNPIMPGVLIIEAIAQTGAVLMSRSERLDMATDIIVFAGLEKARLRHPVRPGDTLRLDVELLSTRHGLYKFKGEACLESGGRAADVSFSARIMKADPE